MNTVTNSIEMLAPALRQQIGAALLQLRSNLAEGSYLRETLYTVDESRLAGNTHHYWIRLGLHHDPRRRLLALDEPAIPVGCWNWLNSELDRKIIQRLPSEYSTLIKIPFSIDLGSVGDERAKRIARTIQHKLPAAMPQAIFHHEINRLLIRFGVRKQPPSEHEVDMLLAHYGRMAVAKARTRFPEVWDELRGHYVLDSRGARFAKRLVDALKHRNLLTSETKFVDVGSGVGTHVFAVNVYSDAHASGIEIHPGIMKIASVTGRRLTRLGLSDSKRLDFVQSDAFDSTSADLAQYDVLYVYSPLGKWELDIDNVVDCAKLGAVIIFNRYPIRNRENVEPLEKVAGLYAFRKLADLGSND